MAEIDIDIVPIYYDYLIDQHYPVNILVGGRNSGKSFFLEQLAVMNMHNNDSYKMLVVEDVEVNIGAGVKDGIMNRAEEFGLDGLFTAVKIPAEIKHINGNNVIFRGYRTEAQQKQVKSLNEITAIWYEEAENITYEQFKALRMQLRGGDPADRQLFLSLNPINESGFINQYFFQGVPDKVFERFPDGRPKVFIKDIVVDLDEGEEERIPCLVVVSTHTDNPFLTREQRADIEEYKNTDEDLYKMLALGMFVKPQGVFFKEFQQGIHTCEAFALDKGWRRYRAMDYGLDMLACYWIAVDSFGRAYVYRELYQSDLIISDAAKLIAEYTPEDEDIYYTFAPPDMWNRRQETGQSVADIFEDNNIWLTRASNDRQQGWLALKEWMKVYELKDGTKQANIVIFDNCENLIRTLPQLQRDKVHINDVDTKTNHELTHAPDALRYFVAGMPSPAPVKEEKPVYNFGFEKPRTQIDHERIRYI